MEGQGAFGKVPGVINLPQPSKDLGGVLPGLPAVNTAASQDILAKLGGSISPGTMNALQRAAAQFGVSSGMPGSGLALNNLFGNIAGFSENQVQQGLQDYSSVLPTASRTQTVDPALQTQIAETNALNLSAPNPAQAQSYAQGLFSSYLNSLGRSAPRTSPAGGFSSTLTRSGSGGVGGAGYTGGPDVAGGPLGYTVDLSTPVTVPTTNLQAGGPDTGTGTVYMGDQSGYKTDSSGAPVPTAEQFASMSDSDLMNYLLGL